MDTQELLALLDANPKHAATIPQAAKADGATVESVMAAITQAKEQEATQALADAVERAEKAEAANEEIKAELAELRAKYDKLAGFAEKAPKDPGGSLPAGSANKETMTKAEFNALQTSDPVKASEFIDGGGEIEDAE